MSLFCIVVQLCKVHLAELLANAATTANAANTIVKRDSSGGFTVGTITTNRGLSLPVTSSSSAGVITQNGSRLLHTFGVGNFFAGFGDGRTQFALAGAYAVYGVVFDDDRAFRTGSQIVARGLSRSMVGRW